METGGSANSLKSTFLLTHRPPAPVQAIYSTGTGRLRIEFDRPLIQQDLNQANWSGVLKPNAITFDWSGFLPAFTSGRFADIGVNIGLPGAGADRVSFAPPPFDVLSARTRLPTQAFADFPVTIVA